MDEKHNYFLDDEFDERTEKLERGDFRLIPISFGLVHESGDGYYGVSSEFNKVAGYSAFPWLASEVISKLPPMDYRKPLAKIREEMLAFFRPAKEIDIWAYNGSTDFVTFYKLFGHQMAFRDALQKRHGIEKVNFREMKEISRLCAGLVMPDQATPTHVAINDAHHEHARFAAISRWFRDNDTALADRLSLKLLP